MQLTMSEYIDYRTPVLTKDAPRMELAAGIDLSRFPKFFDKP